MFGPEAKITETGKQGAEAWLKRIFPPLVTADGIHQLIIRCIEKLPGEKVEEWKARIEELPEDNVHKQDYLAAFYRKLPEDEVELTLQQTKRDLERAIRNASRDQMKEHLAKFSLLLRTQPLHKVIAELQPGSVLLRATVTPNLADDNYFTVCQNVVACLRDRKIDSTSLPHDTMTETESARMPSRPMDVRLLDVTQMDRMVYMACKGFPYETALFNKRVAHILESIAIGNERLIEWNKTAIEEKQPFIKVNRFTRRRRMVFMPDLDSENIPQSQKPAYVAQVFARGTLLGMPLASMHELYQNLQKYSHKLDPDTENFAGFDLHSRIIERVLFKSQGNWWSDYRQDDKNAQGQWLVELSKYLNSVAESTKRNQEAIQEDAQVREEGQLESQNTQGVSTEKKKSTGKRVEQFIKKPLKPVSKMFRKAKASLIKGKSDSSSKSPSQDTAHLDIDGSQMRQETNNDKTLSHDHSTLSSILTTLKIAAEEGDKTRTANSDVKMGNPLDYLEIARQLQMFAESSLLRSINVATDVDSNSAGTAKVNLSDDVRNLAEKYTEMSLRSLTPNEEKDLGIFNKKGKMVWSSKIPSSGVIDGKNIISISLSSPDSYRVLFTNSSKTYWSIMNISGKAIPETKYSAVKAALKEREGVRSISGDMAAEKIRIPNIDISGIVKSKKSTSQRR